MGTLRTEFYAFRHLHAPQYQALVERASFEKDIPGVMANILLRAATSGEEIARLRAEPLELVSGLRRAAVAAGYGGPKELLSQRVHEVWVGVCVYTHTYIYIHICIYAYIHIYI